MYFSASCRDALDGLHVCLCSCTCCCGYTLDAVVLHRLIAAFDTPSGLPRGTVPISQLGAAAAVKRTIAFDVRSTVTDRVCRRRTLSRCSRLVAGGAHLSPCPLDGAFAAFACDQQTFLAELGTVQLEFRYLTKMTGDPKFATLVPPPARCAAVCTAGCSSIVRWCSSERTGRASYQGASRAAPRERPIPHQVQREHGKECQSTDHLWSHGRLVLRVLGENVDSGGVPRTSTAA